MELWVAALLMIFCLAGGIGLLLAWNKSKKIILLITGIVVFVVLAMGILYCAAVFLLLGGIGGEPAVYNDREEDLPEEANLIILTDMKYDKSRKQYYIYVKAGKETAEKNGVEEIGGEIYVFALSKNEDFYALCWEPGADGLTSRGDYNSPDSFYSWWRDFKKYESGEEPFMFSFDEDGRIDYLFDYYDLTGFTGYDYDYDYD